MHFIWTPSMSLLSFLMHKTNTKIVYIKNVTLISVYLAQHKTALRMYAVYT